MLPGLKGVNDVKNLKVFCSYFIPCFIIFCVPTIVLCSFCFSVLIHEFKNTAYEETQTTLQRSLDDMENKITQIQNAGIQFSQLPLPMEDLDKNILSRMEVIDSLRELMSFSSSQCTEIVFWIPEQSLLYSTKTTYSQESFETIHNFDIIQALTNAYQTTESSETVTTILPNKDGSILYLSCPYPYNGTAPTGQIIFCLNTSQILSTSQEPCQIFFRSQMLVDNTLSTDKDSPSLSKIETISKLGNLRSVTYWDEDDIFARVYQLQFSLTCLTILVCIFSVTVLSWFSYKNYKPVQKLRNSLVKYGVSHPSHQASDEIYCSIQTLDDMFQQNQQLSESVNSQQFLSQSLWFSRLLNDSKINTDYILEQLHSYGITLDYASYCCAVICLEETNGRTLDFRSYLSQYPFIKQYYYIDNHQRMILLLMSETALYPHRLSVLQGIQNNLAATNMSCSIYVGNCYPTADHLTLSYHEALSLIPACGSSAGKIQLYRDSSPTKHTFYPHTELSALTSALQTNNLPLILTALRDISAQMGQPTYDFSVTRIICYQIANLLIKYPLAHADESEVFTITNQYIIDLYKIYEKTGFLNALSTLIKSLGFLQKESPESCAKETSLEDILQYLHDHFTEPDFFLGELCSHFQISQNNLSQQLKRHLGISPHKYLNSLRIERAKQLLIRTNKPIKIICQESGYSDQTSFMRNFKLFTSTTPKAYREAYKKQSYE